jgi:Tfp pilus assembly protein PilX
MIDMKHPNEKGVALIFTLFLMASLSAMAVSLMFLSQTETSATRNYRTMSQARYAGEAGVHKAINYLLNSYTVPSSVTGFNTSVSPVTCTSGCTTTGPVVLSTSAGVPSNYPDATIASAFGAAVQGTLATNVEGVTNNLAKGTVSYTASATLMSLRLVNVYGGGLKPVLTWRVTAAGVVPGPDPSAPSATVEVTAMLEREYVDAQTFAIFATGTGCGAINLTGNVTTNSYDSTNLAAGSQSSGGNVGTNGNMTIGGSVLVQGTLSSPRTGVGACVDGSGVDALTESGSAKVCPAPSPAACPPVPVSNGLVRLPQALNFETPTMPAVPVTSLTAANLCAAVLASAPLATCVTLSGTTTIDPKGATINLGSLPDVNLVLKGGNYNINSIGSGDLTVGPSVVGTTQVVINLQGKDSTGAYLANPVRMGGNSVMNASMDPARLQLIYGGTGTIEMKGNAQAAAMIYAPNATFGAKGSGTSDFYGSILAAGFSNEGNPTFHYDRRLQNTFFTLGNYVMTSFSWKKY